MLKETKCGKAYMITSQVLMGLWMELCEFEKLNVEAESEYSFDTVLAVGEEGSVKFGNPTVKGAKVTGKVVKNGKGKKLNILTYRPKKGSARRMGHRQPYTKVEITAING